MKTIARAHRLAGAGPGAVLRRTRIACRPRTRVGPAGPEARQRRRPRAHRRARLSAHRQLRRLRSAAAGARRRPRLRRPGPADAGRRRAGHPAGLEGDHRRPRVAARESAGTSTSRRMSGAAAACWASAAATRCSAARIADPHGIEGPPQKVDGLGLLDVDTVLEGDKVLVEVTRRDRRRRRAVQGLRDACRPHDRRARGRCSSLGDGKTDGAVSGDGRVAGCYIHGLLADDRQRQHWLQRIGATASRLRLRSRRRRDARPAGRPPREARRLRPAARAGAASRSSPEHKR